MFVQSTCLFIAIVIVIGFNVGTLQAASRQKRCIVVQKQSGSGSRDDDDDEDFSLPQPKNPRPDRIQADGLRRSDVEEIPAKLLKVNAKPKWLNNRLMIRNKIITDHLNSKYLTPYYFP